MLLSAVLPLEVRGQVRLPSLGEAASDEVTVSAEKRLGEQVMREIRRDPDYLDDPELLEYLQSIWQPLVAAARQRGEISADIDGLFAWESFLVRDRSVNAFALPGGYVGVHLALIALTASPDELASVLAHELSHVTQRHIARSIVTNQRQSLLALAGLIVGIVAASRSNSPDMANAAIMGSQAAAVQGQLNFSRDMEREADRVGFGVMQQAGFASGGMAAMFEKLDQANRLNDSGAFPYLRTHPLTVERVAEARARAGASPVRTAALTRLEHQLMQSRARVLMDPAVQARRRLQELDADAPGAAPRERLAALYASSLASTQLRDFARAERAWTDGARLAEALPREEARARQLWAMLGVELALAQGDATRAAQRVAGLPDSGSRAALLLKSQVAVAANEPAQLRRQAEALQAWVAERRHDALAWTTLSQCAEAQGQKLRAVRAQAESHAAIGDLPGAIDRLRAGQRLARGGAAQGDFIEASVIDARLRELEAQRRQLMAELRGKGQQGPQGPQGRDGD
ncbi:MAG: M48 family metalloprotease [Burkholderiaceae bacterium]